MNWECVVSVSEARILPPGLVSKKVEEQTSIAWCYFSCRVCFLQPCVLDSHRITAGAEDAVRLIPFNQPRTRSWRMFKREAQPPEYDFTSPVFRDQWLLAKEEARSTGMFGSDYAELSDIAQAYQLSLQTPVNLLLVLARVRTNHS